MTKYNKTTIEVSKDTRNRLAELCKKDDTFDGIINKVIDEATELKK